MRDHKSLLAWQEAHAVVLALLPAIRSVKHAYANPISTQLQRAALSVQLNIAEGYALKASKRFRNHLDIAYARQSKRRNYLSFPANFVSFQPSSLFPHSSTAGSASGCSEASFITFARREPFSLLTSYFSPLTRPLEERHPPRPLRRVGPPQPSRAARAQRADLDLISHEEGDGVTTPPHRIARTMGQESGPTAVSGHTEIARAVT